MVDCSNYSLRAYTQVTAAAERVGDGIPARCLRRYSVGVALTKRLGWILYFVQNMLALPL